MLNAITPNGKSVAVSLDPEELIKRPVYTRLDGKTVRTNFVVGHVLECIAAAAMQQHAPDLIRKFNAVKMEFKNGKYVVTFAETTEDLLALSDVGE